MKRLTCIVLLTVWSAAAGGGSHAAAEDVYYFKPIRELTLVEGALRRDFDQPVRDRFGRQIFALQPYLALEGAGEAYLALDSGATSSPEINAAEGRFGSRIAMRVPQRREIRGKLYFPKTDQSGVDELTFRVPAGEGRPAFKDAFLRTKQAHYERLGAANLPGAAWFRHQARSAAEALGDRREEAQALRRRFFGLSQATDLESTYALFSGGRAVSENLQLDRVLPESRPDQATLPLETLEGITVREFDWSKLTENLQPALDPLASLIPDDQHALLFPSFAAVLHLIDAAGEQGTPVLRAAEPRAEDALTRERYQRQLCLPLGEAERLFGSQLVQSVAITGGDPYFRTGADVAVLLEAKNPAILRKTIDARVAIRLQENPHAKPVAGEIHGIAYAGARSPGRDISCYVASLDGVVVVANSPRQLERIVAVHRGHASALASLPEFKFFRDRYPRAAAEETALLMISDKTIRRWCGPKWRIAASRRTRAAAVMAEVQAAHLERLVAQKVNREEVQAAFWVPEADHFTLTADGVRSSVYGDLHFQTPISELDLAYVTQEEANLYRRWRDGYQGNWSNFFDPIAVRFSVAPDKLAVDLTVMPLIDNTEYRRLTDVSRGARLAPATGDPHPEALIHGALALNPESEAMKSYGNFAASLVKISPLSWIGDSVAVYADSDPYWKDLAAAEDRDDFLGDNVHRLPVALHVSVRSGLRLTAFLTALRGFIEQTAPGMIQWETKTHHDEHYVKIASSPQARSQMGGALERLAIYYAASGQGLTVTLNESVLHRALERQKARREVGETPKGGDEGPPSWLGGNLGLRVSNDALAIIQTASGEQYRRAMQTRAWGNLPILNEWRRRFPDHDPLTLHAQFWGVRPVCPGGGRYVWNERWSTYESTVYGHPGHPKPGPDLPASLQDVNSANFGVTFEEHGLRGRVELSLTPSK